MCFDFDERNNKSKNNQGLLIEQWLLSPIKTLMTNLKIKLAKIS